MPRYIDADALKETLKDLEAQGNDRKFVKGVQDAIDVFFPQIIDDEPTADVEPVRHGRWELDEIIGGMQDYKCSVCGAVVSETFMMQYKFCPFCGAKLGGDE